MSNQHLNHEIPSSALLHSSLAEAVARDGQPLRDALLMRERIDPAAQKALIGAAALIELDSGRRFILDNAKDLGASYLQTEAKVLEEKAKEIELLEEPDEFKTKDALPKIAAAIASTENVTQSDIAKESGISRAAIAKLIPFLQEYGLLQERDKQRPQRYEKGPQFDQYFAGIPSWQREHRLSVLARKNNVNREEMLDRMLALAESSLGDLFLEYDIEEK